MREIPTVIEMDRLLSERAKNSHYSLSREWLHGFVEAEGSFIGREGQSPFFEITQHASDCFLMLAIKRFIGGGRVDLKRRRDGRLLSVYTLAGKRSLVEKLLPLWQNSYASPKVLKSFQPWLGVHFPQEKIVTNGTQISGNWLAGFTDGDGSFHTVFRRQKDYRIGFQFQAVFDLAQKYDPLFADCTRKNVLLSSLKDQWFSDYSPIRRIEPSSKLRFALHQEIPHARRGDTIQRSSSQKGVDHLRLARATYLDEKVIPLFETYK